jgi:hypothetical protein
MTIRESTTILALTMCLAGCGSSGGSTSEDAAVETSSTAATAAESADTGVGFGAGYGRIAPAGTTVQLNGTATGNDTQLSWEQLSGTTVSLDDANIEDPSFEVPITGASEVLVFQLTLDDGVSALVTDTVSVEVWVPTTSSSLADVGDFSDRTGWACTVDPIVAPELTVTDAGDQLDFVSNGIPSHATGTFPNSGNPNTISVVSSIYNIPTSPEHTGVATEMQHFGITIDGIKLERDTAESYQNAGQWRYEAITSGLEQSLTNVAQFSWLGTDCSNAHVQPTGTYHYHGLPMGLMNEQVDETGQSTDMILGGYAADGFPIYLRFGYVNPDDAASGLVAMQGSWEVLPGTRQSGPGGSYDGTFREDWEYVSGTGDLDECNGRFGVTPEYPEGTYHYFLTDDYPFIPRCVLGTPDASFRFGGPPSL